MKKTEFFKVEGNRINRIRRHCPKCGPGVFLADHKNRFGCGKCGYTEFKSGGKETVKPPVEEKTVPPTESEPNKKNITETPDAKPTIDETSKDIENDKNTSEEVKENISLKNTDDTLEKEEKITEDPATKETNKEKGETKEEK